MTEESEARILLVDDEEMVLTALRSFLQLETPYEVVTHTSPLDALESVNGQPIDVVIADFMMPEMDGVTFLKEVRDRRPEATRILLTGYADKENAIRAINEAGLYYYLEKPWDNEKLQVIVRNGVERAALFRELDARASELESAHDDLDGIRKRLIKALL
ncbi:MAG: response regulator [Gemmatimonadetes bacterium]|uniref:Response regulator n=1 Tax=Candidatus Kutchimonas denitrificans TaxID=3056748 RepID=A0AAE5CB91_9BACT|nr:response regulator [Gemmatimonadota bacterium]NIR74268.1 response regulator [Candidatus Kutchimonas denitrificans]NIS02523.1 response regulator [Gemmatimonadota bacterium]NIT68399.1 response regulator [Gemmatimonadota bacterium]NIU51851.1 response regulator [Gemmatimonadota bacterium]